MATENNTFPSQIQSQTELTPVKVDVMPETMRLVSRVLQKCEEEKNLKLNINFNDPIQRAISYTGFHKDVITTIHLVLKMSGHFDEFEIDKIDRNVIQRALMHFYLNQGVLPTTKQLYDAVQKQLPMYVDIRMFRKELLKMNYMWKKIPNRNLVVIERPTSVFERYHYLKRIISYREESRPIVFVDVCYLNAENEVKILKDLNCGEKAYGYYMYAVSEDDLYALEGGVLFSKFSKDVFINWVRETLCFHIPPNSVVVMSNLRYSLEEIRTLPTENSLKIEMIEWLEFHDIPCSRSMPKMDLFKLVENHTNNIDKLYKIDEILKIHGHDVLRIPDSIENLTPVTFVRYLVQSNFEADGNTPLHKFNGFNRLIKQVNHTHLQHYDKYIAEEELIVFHADKKLDEKMDRICKNMEGLLAYEAEADSDVPTLSDTD